jgi:PTS system fructose-specific IIC component
VTSPAGPPSTGSGDGEQKRLKLLAVTACPTGIAHTYMGLRNSRRPPRAAAST